MARRRIVRGVVAAVALAVVAGGFGVAPASAAGSVTIEAGLTARSIELGQTVAVTGRVAPAGATPKVVVQRSLGGGRWGDRAVATVSADGTFRTTIRPSAAGLYALRVRSGGGTVISATMFLKVKLGPNQAIRGFDLPRLVDTARWEDLQPCGNGDWTARPVDRRKVWYGDVSGDGVEEAPVIVDCTAGAMGRPFSAIVLFGMSGGKPEALTTWWPPFATSSWSPIITSAAISNRLVNAVGVARRPISGCSGCRDQSFHWHLRYVPRSLEPIEAG